MQLENLTIGQKKALYESLRDQKSPKTPNEKRVYNALREELAQTFVTERGNKVLYIDGYVKEIEMDTMNGEYRFGWIKAHSNSKGDYYTSSYIGGRVKF